MATSLGDFKKRTSAGHSFVIRFLDDGTLIEWTDGTSIEEGWPGTWSSGFVKFNDCIRTVIGDTHTKYESIVGIIGVEVVNGVEVAESSLAMSQHDYMKLQGHR